eukprot:2518917-Amphidinium_carterae.1
MDPKPHTPRLGVASIDNFPCFSLRGGMHFKYTGWSHTCCCDGRLRKTLSPAERSGSNHGNT